MRLEPKSRRHFGWAALTAGAAWWSRADTRGVDVLVVIGSRVPAYEEAMEGLGSVLPASGVKASVLTLDQEGARGKLAAALVRKPAALVAVGSTATEAVLAVDHTVPVIATMILSPGAGQSRRIVVMLTLDIPPSAVLGRVRQLYPRCNRLAVIRGPALGAGTAGDIEATARRLGYQARFVDTPGPRELLENFAALRDQVQMVWCLPDSTLYQPATVSALALAAIRNRLPLIGFSEGFVRAGALVGFYADYRDVGVQTGEALRRHLESQPQPGRAIPRTVRVGVNERVMRVLGVEHVPAEGVVIVK